MRRLGLSEQRHGALHGGVHKHQLEVAPESRAGGGAGQHQNRPVRHARVGVTERRLHRGQVAQNARSGCRLPANRARQNVATPVRQFWRERATWRPQTRSRAGRKDREVCKESGTALVFTRTRHFRLLLSMVCDRADVPTQPSHMRGNRLSCVSGRASPIAFRHHQSKNRHGRQRIRGDERRSHARYDIGNSVGSTPDAAMGSRGPGRFGGRGLTQCSIGRNGPGQDPPPRRRGHVDGRRAPRRRTRLQGDDHVCPRWWRDRD